MAGGTNPKIKKANQQVEMTHDQVLELMECADDPVYFCRNYVKIQHPTKGAINFDMYPYQEELLRMYQNNRYSIALSARQTGKEQPHSAKIMTPSGWTTMGDIQVGDEISAIDGTTTKVLAKYPQGSKDTYLVTFDDGSSTRCGLDHLWTIYRRKYKNGKAQVCEEIITLREMIEIQARIEKRNDYNNVRMRIPVTDAVYHPERQFPIDPYLLGCLIGDGSYAHSSVMLTSVDASLIKEVTPMIESLNCSISLKEHNMSNGLDYKIVTNDRHAGNTVMRALRGLGLAGTNSDTKFIPEQYMFGSVEQRYALLQGLMDTDGAISVRKNGTTCISFSTTSKQLRDDFQQLVWSLGGKCSYCENPQQNPNHKMVYDCFISLMSPKRCFRLESKQVKCNEVYRNGAESQLRRAVVSVENVGEEESSCILVEHPTHLYITDDYVVTHNSITSAAYLLWFSIFHDDKTILIASNKNSNAMEMIFRIRFAYENLPFWLKPGVTDDGWNKHNITFDNGSRMISEATSENSGRGLSISLVFLDEFAFVKQSVQDEFWTSIAPTLSTGGACIITSTPNGDMDIFATIWRGAQIPHDTKKGVGINGFASQFVAWDEPPGRDEQFKEDEINRLGQRKWDQEYECLAGINTVQLLDGETGEELTLTIEELYKWLDDISHPQ